MKNIPNYHISIIHPEKHYINIKYSFISPVNGLQSLFMPVWTPGSYKIREFSRHINNITGKINGNNLKIEQTDKSCWKYDCKKGDKIVIKYQVYAREMTVRTSYLDTKQAMINGASIFIYNKNLINNPINLSFDYPNNWKGITTSLDFNKKKSTYCATNYDHLIDSPIFIGTPELHSFNLKNKLHYFAIIGKGNYDIKKIISDTKNILSSFYEIFLEFPYKSYTFITHLYENLYGGLEHRDSCHIIFSRWKFNDRKEYIKFISLVAHEYFHTYNVKRIRPIELGPFDYQNENYTKMLWIAEGMTSYYDEFILRKANVITVKEYFVLLSENIKRYFSIPGRSEISTKDSSFLAWIKLYIQNENSINTSISYYLTGGLIGLILDLKLRQLTSGKKSLNDVYRILWNKYKNDGKGITQNEFIKYSESIAGSSLKSIFDYLDNPEDIDLVSALSPFGLELKLSRKETNKNKLAWLGISFDQKEKMVIKSIRSDGPAASSELSVGDEILAINYQRFTENNKDNLMKNMQIGKSSKLHINRMGDIMEITVIAKKIPFDNYQIKTINKPSKSQKLLFESWLGVKWNK